MRTEMHQLESPNNIPSNRSVLITPPPKQLLMLEGDEMYISPNGQSHTVYQLLSSYNVSSSSHCINNDSRREQVTLEEVYDIESAKKTISLHIDSASSSRGVMGGGNSLRTSEMHQSIIREEREENCFTFDIQEVNNGVLNGSGTGSMSWDSSIVMGLYFTQHPNELHGNILELGSGVGLGGILSLIINNSMSISHDDEMKSDQKSSMTLTDINDDVLSLLKQNVTNALYTTDYISIRKLDWFDYLDTSIQRRTDDNESDDEKYDTIIASDCAYLHQQVVPLSNTITRLLSTKNSSKLHMFVPYNRGVVYELIDELERKDMHVLVDEVELSKYRIKQNICHMSSIWNNSRSSLLNEASRCGSKFLHIIAWHKTKEEIDEERWRRNEDHSMDDID